MPTENREFRMSSGKKAVSVTLFLLLAGCQTTGLQSPSGGPSTMAPHQVAKDSYNIFYDQHDHLNDLVAAGNYDDASILYEEQRAYFDAKAADVPEVASALSKVADEVSSPLKDDIAQSREVLSKEVWPAPQSAWDRVRTGLERAEEVLARIPNDGVFVNPAYRPDEADDLELAVSGLRAKVERTVSEDFREFDHFTAQDFFGKHPTKKTVRSLLDGHPALLKLVLNDRTENDIASFARVYKSELETSRHWKAVGNAYINARMAKLPTSERDLSRVFDAIAQASELGLEIGTIGGIDIGFVEVTSRSLLKAGQVEFPAAVEVDLPFSVSKGELNTALTAGSVDNADYLIVFDVALAKSHRKVGRLRKQRSEMIVGYRQEPNPAYARLKTALDAKRMESQNAAMNTAMAQSQYCYGLGCLGKIAGVAAAASKQEEVQAQAQELMNQLNATPLTIDVPVKQAYNYEVADLEAQKTMTVHYYVIDKVRKRYFKSTFDVVENRRFGVAYRVAETDPDRQANIGKHDTEQDVADWEKQASTVSLSQLINHFTANQSRSKPLTDVASLRREMLRDRNIAIAAYKSNTFEESTANDPRFDSVVAVYMPEGQLGSGFFVRPDVVMTNYHVVGEGEFAELKMHDEQETFGKVIARDARLDLALIKVQARGKPVLFWGKNKIALGSTVEAIGHPRGYEFSITRGIVSAVRKHASIVLQGGDEVLQVQIDAAISPGNSGGPVFLGDRVISVVDWIRADRGSQNLNFSIHHSEAERFIADSLGGGS